MTTTGSPHLAVALSGAGWHPLAWREPDARPADLTRPAYWRDIVGAVDRAGVDLVTIADGFRRRPPTTDDIDRPITDLVAGRLDSVLIAARVAPTTTRVGVLPTLIATHTEPFHAAKAIATLDFVGRGRAGAVVDVAATDIDARLFGRRTLPDEPSHRDTELHSEATDYVEVLRRLWDSWEHDAEIRDVATGRFIDRDKLHYIDFEGRFFSVRGPSITPRPPQGQPVVAASAHGSDGAVDLVGSAADIGFVAAHDRASTSHAAGAIRDAAHRAGRASETVHVFVDLLVYLDDTDTAAADRRARLDDLLGTPYTGGTAAFAGTPASLADLIADLTDPSTGATGIRLRPATIPHDLHRITDEVVPELRRRNAFRVVEESSTLRTRLGLTPAANRYARATEIVGASR
ncbi:LLM class flavin-dependent oxidoreductase [Gordonia sp. OPL2]|uniref:LLM class flavin-dependent oxidoreductase n=1 Tax=Gordonia sp. OPL2 TaxID=2486274 RepID=UPI00165592DD|nr:LLM class flavin-dependent oxidoreductase [Gordonia sp. OPL2]ROZ99383.1 LLM class flavin-dependent oxidoreductase [Gordonia sp. OPL2]